MRFALRRAVTWLQQEMDVSLPETGVSKWRWRTRLATGMRAAGKQEGNMPEENRMPGQIGLEQVEAIKAMVEKSLPRAVIASLGS